MELADVLRRCVLDDKSISLVARKTGVAQATLQEFAVGKSDGSYADLRLSSAQRLIDHYGIQDGNRKRRKPRKNGGKRMKLVEELQAGECADSPEKFRERLVDHLIDSYPETTIDELVCTPDLALSYCNGIRDQVGSEFLSDVVILKALMNIRKQKSCPKGLKSRGRRRNVKRELLNAGCDLSPDLFKDLVVDCLAAMFRDLTIDELVCQPREARPLCNYVRSRAECRGLTDNFILSTLMNVRKAGQI